MSLVANQPKWVSVSCPNATCLQWLKNGDVVYLEGIVEQGIPPALSIYIGRFTVRNVNTVALTFDYDTKGIPSGNPSLGTVPAPAFFYVWRWSRITYENNVFDDWARNINSYTTPHGILGAPADDSLTGPNAILPDWIVRENEFRYVDGVPSPVADAQDVVLVNADGAVVDSNRVDLPGTHLVEFKRVQNVQSVMGFQNRRTQQGAWVSTWFDPTGKYLEDIITRIEDVTSICF